MKRWIYGCALFLATAALMGCNDSSGSGSPTSESGSGIVGTWYAKFVSAGGESHKLLTLNADRSLVEYDTAYPLSEERVARMTGTWSTPKADSLVLTGMQLFVSWDNGATWDAPKNKPNEGTLFEVYSDTLVFFSSTSQSIWVRRR